MATLIIPSPRDVATQLIVYALAVGLLTIVIVSALVYGVGWALFGEEE